MIVREITERKQQQQELEASRQRIVAAGDDARRKLERNLHDGAQQRLVSLSLSLRLAQGQAREETRRGRRSCSRRRAKSSTQALEELRELARGIHPGSAHRPRARGRARGARRSRAAPGRDRRPPDASLPAPVEAAAYYVVSEALANVTKYAAGLLGQGERRAGERLRARRGRRTTASAAQIPRRGSGLRGLADRVASLNGKLAIDSPPGAGTRVRAEIPLE